MRPAARAGSVQSGTDRLLARAVSLCDVEDHTKNVIATQLGINRLMFVQLLTDPHRCNRVRMTLSTPLAEFVALETLLEARFNIVHVHLNPLFLMLTATL